MDLKCPQQSVSVKLFFCLFFSVFLASYLVQKGTISNGKRQKRRQLFYEN
jgi:hypothetical protein